MKVLFITRKWHPAVGGMELYSKELTQELRLIVDLDIRALPGRANGSPPSLARLALFIMTSAWLVWRRRQVYDVIHFGDFVLYPLAWWHKLVAPQKMRVLSVFGLDLLYGNRTGFAPMLYRSFMAWTNKHPAGDLYIASSKNTQDIAREARLSPCTIVTLGIRKPEGGQPAPRDTLAPYILFAGRLVRRKGAAWFAANVLPDIPSDYTLQIAGQVWDKSEAEGLSQNHRVVLHGQVTNEKLRTLREKASIIIMPNIPSQNAGDAEGFGLTALEAAASGSPLIAADLEGISDAVVDGKTGFLVDAGNKEAWVKKIMEVLAWDETARVDFAKGASLTLDEKYSWAQVAENTLAAYHMCLKTSAVTRTPGEPADGPN